jgi:Oligosaccharide biosynthesis protein Alg14 like
MSPITNAPTPRLLDPTVLTLLCGGGFLFETKCLLRQMRGKEVFTYLSTEFGGQPGFEGVPDGSNTRIPTSATVTNPSIWKIIKSFTVTLGTTMSVLRQRSIKSVIVVGASYTVPMLLAGRISGLKTVYIESITRADRLSNTGRIVYHLRLASLFVVQWPALQKTHKRSTLGTIL